MGKNLLFEALSALKPAALRAFDKFVRSPYFNTRPEPALLLAYLGQCLDQSAAPEAEKAFAAIFPGQKYNDARLRMQNSALLSLLDQFLAQKEAESDERRQKIRTARAYRKLQLPKHFQIALREARAGVLANPQRDALHFQLLYEIEWETFQFESAAKRTDALNLQAPSDLLDAAFLLQKIRLACLTRSHEAVYNTQYHLELLEPVLQVAEAAQEQSPALALYLNCYRFLSDPEDLGAFNRLRTLLDAHAEVLPPDDLRTLFLLAINFAIKKLNSLEPGWLEATLALYRSALERETLLENGVFSRFAFNNIVAIALRLGELGWAENFVGQYKPLLERAYREATADLNLARIAYARRDLHTALLHLQRADYKDTLNNLTAKTLQLKIFYETDAFDLLESHLKSMQTYIRRHTGIGYHRTNYSRIVYFTRQLLQLNFHDAASVETFKKRLRAEPILTEKEWFLEKL